MPPGETAFTRMPSVAYSSAAVFVRPITACLLLAGDVNAHARKTNQSGDRGIVHDRTAAISQHGRNLVLHSEQHAEHIDVHLGATGTGKSSLLHSMLMQDIEGGAGVYLLDPHGNLYHEVCEVVPPRRINDVILIEPADVERAVGLNFLEYHGPYPQAEMNFIANELIRIFDRLYDLRQTGGPMFELYMRNALFLVMDNDIEGGTLMDIPLLFEDDKYRSRRIEHCRNPHTVGFWRGQAERAGGETSLKNMAPYITSKLNQFTCNGLLRPIIGQPQSTVTFRECMDRGRIVLVNLSKGRLGEFDTRLLGMLVIGKLFQAALQRVDVPASKRRPFFLYVDEVQNFTTDTVGHLFAEARKFGLCLTLANQTLGQVGGGGYHPNLIETILGNVGSLILFRLRAPDAEKLVVRR
jgi:Type IV secretion-system coupling protein DNA-binding domain